MKRPPTSVVLTGRGRRSAEQRAAARELGVDRFGRPTARALGISPRQLRKRLGISDSAAAAALSRQLLAEAHARLRGEGRSPSYSPGFPAEREQSRPGGPTPRSGVDGS